MKPWLLLVTHLPTENATTRVRAWRALKASGAAVLRDGVYLLPDEDECRAKFDAVAQDIRQGGGRSRMLSAAPLDDEDLRALFDRSEHYGVLLTDIGKAHAGLHPDFAVEALRQSRKLRKAFEAIGQIDFFPGEAKRQCEAALEKLERQASRALAPDEPAAVDGEVERLDLAAYRARTWATRRRPWADRLACAWLIRRHIDPKATILWLEAPADCPPEALGFDFDGAVFTHVGARVSFEVMLAAFGLEQPALRRLGALIHFIDVGGIQPPEAAGVESVMAGLRAAIDDDDALLAAASHVFDGLVHNFEKQQGMEHSK